MPLPIDAPTVTARIITAAQTRSGDDREQEAHPDRCAQPTASQTALAEEREHPAPSSARRRSPQRQQQVEHAHAEPGDERAAAIPIRPDDRVHHPLPVRQATSATPAVWRDAEATEAFGHRVTG
jgi:hypothetical protein